MVKYAPLEGRGWQPLPEFLAKKNAIINIRNNDERCFGYSILYFHDRANLSERNSNCSRVSLYKGKMFIRYHLDMLPYPISPNNVHQYEDQLQMNINVFSIFDDEGRASHPMVISRKNYEHVANLLYWKEHYAPITNIHRMFKDITNTQTTIAVLPAVPWSLFIGGSSCATPKALHSRRLHVGAPCAPGARLQPRGNQIQQVQVLYKGAVRHICWL